MILLPTIAPSRGDRRPPTCTTAVWSKQGFGHTCLEGYSIRLYAECHGTPKDTENAEIYMPSVAVCVGALICY